MLHRAKRAEFGQACHITETSLDSKKLDPKLLHTLLDGLSAILED
jgi:hypothetical protein